jgi:hypothetical protein
VSSSSWRKVPYGTRTAKHVERKMLAEAMARLDALRPLEEWRYVGLGSLWFTDFALFHRRLGLRMLHSIEDEQDDGLQARFRGNAPFATQMHFGQTTSELPKVPWDRPAVVWLDYDDKFRSWMFEDVDHVVSACQDPTLLLFTFNVSPGPDEGRRADFVERLGSEDRLPRWAKRDSDLGPDLRGRRGMANAVREVMTDQVEAALLDRGGTAMRYEQVFHFRYADGAQMATVGGLLSSAGGAACHFDNLPFYRPDATPFHIQPPVVTLREGLALEALLPDTALDPAHLPGLTKAEVASFRELYRYLPSFVDAEI